MTEKRQAYEIFKRAADLSETKLEDFLDQACGASVGLRKQVDELLAMETEAEDFLPEEASATPVDVAELLTSSDQQLERNVGPYKLRQEIGEGGFGVVYLATQQEPMRRDVALKIIKPGMDSREVIARFEVERQALALMDHPNIARVFDAGQTDSGRPYFVMELVKGMPITEFCDKHNLSTTERLKLFISVCNAVQHAHQKGVIHRDLKPTNILVTLDGVPAAKVIDFGVAKSISQRFTEKTLFTQMGQMIGTPQYMSPEQAEMSGLDVDTRSDIYSLGVVLYELLTGTTPLDAERLRTAGYREMQQIIQEEEPPTPSTRVSKLGQESTIASRRGLTDARRLRNTIKGDLDWIVMRALEKRRDRRYETVNGLAADLERYLNDEPIVARPPSFIYRFQKALSRNKGAFITTAVVAIALIASSVISSWQMVVARRAQANEQEQRLKAEAAEKQVEANLYTSLLGQIRATRNARHVGYREDVFALVRQALAMDSPQKNLSDLRDEAVGCMGDFSGFRAKQIVTGGGPEVPMKLSPDDRWLARFHADGIEVRELRDIDSESPSARKVGRWKFEISDRSFTFNRSGDRLLARTLNELREFRLNRAGEWQQRGPWSIPNAIGILAMDNSILAVVGDGSRLHLFDPETGQKRDSFDVPLGPATGIRKFAFTPDSQKMAIVNNNNTLIELWDVKQGRLLRASSPERPIGQTLAFNEDGRFLSALTGTGMRVYDTEADTEELRKVGEYNAASPNGSRDVQAFLPGYSVLASPSSTRRGVVVRDFLRKENLYVLEEKSEVRRALFSAEGDFLLTQSGDGVKLYSLRRPKERLVLPGHPSKVNGIAFSPDGSRLASISADHTIRMWDPDSGKRVWKGELVGEGGNALAFSPDGRLLATGCNASHVVQLWDAETGTEVLPIPPKDDDPDARWQRIKAKGDWTWGLAFVSDKEKGLLLCRRSFHIMEAWQIGDVFGGGLEAVHDISFGSLSGTEFDVPSHIKRIFLTPSNQTIAIVEQRETKSCCLVKDPFGSTPAIVSIPWHLKNCVTPDGRALVALIEDENGRQNMRVVLIDVATGSQVRDFPVPVGSADSRQLALSSKERWLALTNASGRGVDIYDFATGERQYTLPATQASVSRLAWDPSDEARLAIAIDSGDVSIWNLEFVEMVLTELGLGFPTESDN